MTDNQTEVAHIVFPSEKMRAVIRGDMSRVKAMCGVFVKKGMPDNAPICRSCFNVYRDKGEPEEIEEGGR